MKRKAKIIATIGPASSSVEVLSSMIESGMNFARLNMSHGTHESHRIACERIREISHKKGIAVGILLDLQGPRIRTGTLEEDQLIELVSGSSIQISTEPVSATNSVIQIQYPHLTTDLKVGDPILIADGQLELRITNVLESKIEADVITGGVLGSRKGVNFPGAELSVSGLLEKDYEDLTFGVEMEIDAIAMSFVCSGEDIVDLRNKMMQISPDCEHIPVIAKLERPQALDHLDSILEHADGVMIARGDLGVEVSPEKVPSLQKQIIKKAMAKKRFSITATQMLESMIRNPRPTRAEASDVANAVFDGSDILMLSGETSIGKHPVKAIQTMERIIIDAESHSSEWGVRSQTETGEILESAPATTIAARNLAENCNVSAIAVFTRSGRTARLMANARPKELILAFTPEPDAYRQMALLWGVEPHLVPMSNTVEEMIEHVESALLHSESITRGEKVVVVASLPIGEMGPANFVLLHTIG
jgi:pyruvate kinase